MPTVPFPAISRRRFLGLALGGAGAALTGSFGCELAPLSDWPFKLGVASGDPLWDRVVLWTRLAPDPLATDGQGGMPGQAYPVVWEVAHDESFRQLARWGVSEALPEFAHAVHVDVDGLEPDRWYFYRFMAYGYVSDTGCARTLPARGSAPTRLRFASASCQNYKEGYYTAYAAMALDSLDLVVFLGDYIYESGIDGPVRQHDAGRIQDLAGYRNRYALYKGDPDLQRAHGRCPWIVTWDDHEVSNNYAGLQPDESAPDDAPPADLFPMLRAWAYQAWWEHMPVRMPAPIGPSFRIYRRFPFGDLAQFLVLDTRQYRTNQECGDALKPRCAGFPSPDGDLLGAAQAQWLAENLATSNKRWDVVAQQVVFAPTPIGNQLNFDQWDGYPLARQRVIDVLRARAFRKAVVLSGDIHAAGAGWVPGDTAAFTDPVASEFVATGISSSGLDPGTAALARQVIEALPHIDYFEAVPRGYVRHDVRRDLWRSDFRYVATTLEPASTSFTGASFVVERGSPAPQRVF